jgi:hypothetical protein
MIPGEPQPLRVLYVGPEQAGCHGKTEVAGQRDGLVGDELRYRELDDALGLTALAGDVLADARTGKNGRHATVGLLWQSMFGRLAGYENVNDVERLRHDPTMRWNVGGKAPRGRTASPSQRRLHGTFPHIVLWIGASYVQLQPSSTLWTATP